MKEKSNTPTLYSIVKKRCYKSEVKYKISVEL